MKGKKKKHYSW